MDKYNIEEESWKDIEGYEGLYQISNLGRVKSLSRDIQMNGYIKRSKMTYLRFSRLPYGYLTVALSKRSIKKQFYIHRLVALYFVDNPNKYNEVNHIDEDKENNSYLNLEWCTRKQNMNHGSVMKRINAHPNTIASKKKGIKVVGINVKNGHKVSFNSLSEAGRNGFTQSGISRTLSGEQPNHKGYKWIRE